MGFIFFWIFSAVTAFAHDGALCTREDPCDSVGFFSQKQAGPTKGDAIRVNPAAVPVEDVTGVETIMYKGAFDFSLVKGLGRVGAAISPSNNDETFFGPPSDEDAQEFFDRMEARTKFDAGKYTLAAAVNLYSSKGSGFSHQNLNLGLMGRYQAETRDVTPGVGLQAIIGPFYLGGAVLKDEEQIHSAGQPVLTLNTVLTSYGGGLSLDSFLFDYSVLQVSGDSKATASVATLTGFIGRFILTGSRRQMHSDKPTYDFSQHTLFLTTADKVEYFGGVQFRAAHFLVLGAFYNYYLLREISLGATLFF